MRPVWASSSPGPPASQLRASTKKRVMALLPAAAAPFPATSPISSARSPPGRFHSPYTSPPAVSPPAGWYRAAVSYSSTAGGESGTKPRVSARATPRSCSKWAAFTIAPTELRARRRRISISSSENGRPRATESTPNSRGPRTSGTWAVDTSPSNRAEVRADATCATWLASITGPPPAGALVARDSSPLGSIRQTTARSAFTAGRACSATWRSTSSVSSDPETSAAARLSTSSIRARAVSWARKLARS